MGKQHNAPDGGWGWMVVIGCFLVHLTADGILNSFGVYYSEFLDYFHSDKGETAWIASLWHTMYSLGGINFSVLYLASIVCLGNYFDKKRAFALGISVCGTGIGTFVIAPLTKYLVDQYSWQGAIFIESAILLNCAVSGALYRPLPITKQQNGRGSEDEKSELYPVAEMENKMIGCSTGANRVEILVKNDFEIYRKSNVQKIDSCHLSLPQIDIGSKDVCSKILEASQEKTPLKITDDHDLQFNHTNLNNRTVMQKCNEHFNFVLYLDVAFVLFCMTNSLAGLGTIMPYVYLVDRAKEAGIPEVKGAFLLSTAGIANTISRFVFGWIADRPFSNPSYLCAGALLICGLSTCLSPLNDSYEFLACYAALFGACAGIYISLFPIVLVQLMGIENLSSAVGLAMLPNGLIVLPGTPIAGFIFYGTGSYAISFYSGGAIIIISGILFIGFAIKQRQRRKNGTDF